MNGAGTEGLRRVLRAYALHNPEVGYCQSLNFVAGMMLLFLQEEDAFWLLATIIENLLPPEYYTKSMLGAYVDQWMKEGPAHRRYCPHPWAGPAHRRYCPHPWGISG
jgi:hypothetical protein